MPSPYLVSKKSRILREQFYGKIWFHVLQKQHKIQLCLEAQKTFEAHVKDEKSIGDVDERIGAIFCEIHITYITFTCRRTYFMGSLSLLSQPNYTAYYLMIIRNK